MLVDCLREEISTGNKLYPIYVGFLSADDIAKVAEAPAFLNTTAHKDIANKVVSQPVDDWQRPIDGRRTQAIANTFDNSGQLMPNPVLIGINALVNGKITIAPKSVGPSGQLSGTYEVKIDTSNIGPGRRPLWILDGQHRVAGLARSKQKKNPIPVVFLLDNGNGVYTPSLLASLFAQVTTAAEKLDPLHNEWLTYAFNLDSYAPSNDPSQNKAKAFEAVVELCRQQTFAGVINPFLNAVQFNAHESAEPKHGGFSYRCTELQDLFYNYYYKQPKGKAAHLSPAALAAQVALAYSDLYKVLASHAPTNVFFGSSGQNTIMQTAYLTGVLARILSLGPQTSWQPLLQNLQFHQSSWDFSTWTKTLSGTANKFSKKIATNVLSEALTSGKLPSGSSNIPDHLKGNAAELTLEFSPHTQKNRPTKSGRLQVNLVSGSNVSQSASQTRHLKVTKKSTNIGNLEIKDANAPGGMVGYPQLVNGSMILTKKGGFANPLSLAFMMTHYGGRESMAQIDINW